MKSTRASITTLLIGTAVLLLGYGLLITLLPLRARIFNESQLHYNAMQMGVFDLLRAQERQIQTAAAYIDAQLSYWLARTDLDQLLSGLTRG